VTDVARANLTAATAGDGRIYCVGTGVGTSVNYLYQKLCDVLNISVEPNRAPRRPGDLRTAYFDTRRAQDELNWRPVVSLEDGLRDTVETVRQDLALDLVQTG